MALSFQISAAERSWLLQTARQSIESGLARLQAPAPEPDWQHLCSPANAAPHTSTPPASALQRHLGSFVTLNLGGQLRGCIGSIIGREPLWRNVWRMANAAAFEDPRFPPLRLAEWPHTELHISVLDELRPCPDPTAICVGQHGLALEYAGRSGVFLPQVPAEQGWDRLTYLDQLCLKAGLPKGAWQQPGARLYWYEALVFMD